MYFEAISKGYTQEQLEEHGIQEEFMGYMPPISLQNEIDTWEYIADRADWTLQSYPTTILQNKPNISGK